MEAIRRVVTGVDEQGKSIFVSDEEVEPKVPQALGGNRVYLMWGDDETPHVPNDGAPATGLRFFPADERGYRYVIFTMPPQSEVTVPDDLDAALVEMEELTPGMGDAVSDASGVHYSATIDLEFVLEGEFTLVLDDGVEKTIPAGTSLVQCGARHAWHNRSDTMAKMLLVFVGATMDESKYAPANH